MHFTIAKFSFLRDQLASTPGSLTDDTDNLLFNEWCSHIENKVSISNF